MEVKRSFRKRSRANLSIRYTVNPRLAYFAACLYPGSIIAPSTLTLGALTIPRLFLLIAGLGMAREMWRKISSGGYVPIATDIIVPMMVIWMLTAIYLNGGAGAMAGLGALAAVEFLVGYFLARIFFGTPAGFAQFVRVLRFVTLFILATALLDTLSGRTVFAQFGYMLSGGAGDRFFPTRFGLVRAMGSLEHPILTGTFFVICIIIFFHSTLTPIQKALSIAVSTCGALLPLSSAPLLSLIMSIGIVVLLRLFRSFPWRMLVLSCTLMFVLATFVVLIDDPLTVLIQNLTYDPQTGMFRVMIWQWVGLNIEKAPWIGIGLADWMRSPEMPSSIDSLYLVQAIRYGLPALALLCLTIVSTGITMPMRPQHRYPSEGITAIRVGMAIAIFIYSFNAFTVHFWGSSWAMFAIVLGIRAGLTESIYLDPIARGDALAWPGDAEPSSNVDKDVRVGRKPISRGGPQTGSLEPNQSPLGLA